MSTTTTVPTVIDGFLDAINAELTGVTAYETWPGPEASPEMVVIESDSGDPITWVEYQIPVIMAGRRQRQEQYEIGWAVYVFGTKGTSPSNPKKVRDRAFEIVETLEDVLAEDVTAGTSHAVVQDAQLRLDSAGPRVFEKAWAYRITGALVVRARLT